MRCGADAIRFMAIHYITEDKKEYLIKKGILLHYRK